MNALIIWCQIITQGVRQCLEKSIGKFTNVVDGKSDGLQYLSLNLIPCRKGTLKSLPTFIRIFSYFLPYIAQRAMEHFQIHWKAHRETSMHLSSTFPNTGVGLRRSRMTCAICFLRSKTAVWDLFIPHDYNGLNTRGFHLRDHLVEKLNFWEQFKFLVHHWMSTTILCWSKLMPVLHIDYKLGKKETVSNLDNTIKFRVFLVSAAFNNLRLQLFQGNVSYIIWNGFASNLR